MRVGGPQAGHPAPEARRPLDQHDLQAEVGQTDRRAHPGDAATDDQDSGHRLHGGRLQRLGEPGVGDAGADQPERLAGGAVVVVGVRPRALLTDVHLGVLIGVEPGPPGHAAEGERVQLGRAGRDHHAVELVLGDVLGDLLLGGVRAGEHGVTRHHHVGVALDGSDDLVDVDVVGDVASAVADVDADPAFARGGTGVGSAFLRRK